MQLQNHPPSKCPQCGKSEVPATTPRTIYACGSSDYDQRPGTFRSGIDCKQQDSAAEPNDKLCNSPGSGASPKE